MAEKESVRDLLLRVKGEVDPSTAKVIDEAIKNVEEAGKRIGLTQDQMDEQLVAYMRNARAAGRIVSDMYAKIVAALKAATKEQKKHTDEKKKDTKTTDGQVEARKRFIKVLKGVAKGLKDVGKAVLFVAGGFGLLLAGASVALVGVARLFKGIANAAINAGRAGVEALKQMGEQAIEINADLELATLTLTALAKSEQGAASLMRVIREEAMRTGKSFRELAAAAPRLVPWSGGDIAQFRELIGLAARVNALRPELAIGTAIRTMGQFLSGYEQTLYRTFNIPTALILSVTKEMGNNAAALDVILEKFRISEELVEAQAGSWKGLTTILRDFGEQSLMAFTAPLFGKLRDALKKAVDWLKEYAPQIRSLFHHLGEDVKTGFGKMFTDLVGPEGFSDQLIFDAAEWGANLVASLVQGILWGTNNVLIPAIVKVTEIIAGFLKGSSPPRMGLLATIDQWFGPLIRAYLEGFDAADFRALADITKIIKASLTTAVSMGDIDQKDMNQRLLQTRSLIVDIVQQLKETGTVAAAAWAELGSVIGMDVRLIQAYLGLVNAVKVAQAALAKAQAAYAAAMKKVRKVQEEIRLFELRTAEIPERYKRGRRMELEFKLMAAQKLARIQQDAVKAAQAQLRAAKESLAAFMQMISALEQLAKDAAQALEDAKEADDALDFDFGPIEGVGDEVETLTGRFKDLYDSIITAFAEVKDEMKYLMDFFKGLLGKPAFTQEEVWAGVTELPEGYKAGVRFAEAIQTIADNFYKVTDAIKDAVTSIREFGTSTTDWWEGLPQWLRTLLATPGMVTQSVIDIVLAFGFGKTKGLLTDVDAILEALPSWLSDLLYYGVLNLSLVLDFVLGTEPLIPDWLGDIVAGDVGKSVGSTLDDVWRTIEAFFTGKEAETAEAVATGITDPLIAGFEAVEEEAVGHSIFPDMFEAIKQLFSDLPDEITPGMQAFVQVIRVQGRSASRWFQYMVRSMRKQLHALIKTLYSTINALQAYSSAVKSSGASTTSGIPSYQTGGVVKKLETALLHPGELILNIAQQKNLALAIQGSTPSGVTGGGGVEGATVVTVEQSNWTFAGSLSEGEREELRRVAKEGAYEGIAEVFGAAT